MTTAPSRTSTHLIALEARLRDGYTRIDDAVASGIDVTAWESFWIELLDQYVMAVDAFDAIDTTTALASDLTEVAAGIVIAA